MDVDTEPRRPKWFEKGTREPYFRRKFGQSTKNRRDQVNFGSGHVGETPGH
jgi:hypothetical protein